MNKDWRNGIGIAITVTDRDGRIIEMNRTSQEVFAKWGGGKLLGQDLMDCHGSASQQKISAMMATVEANHYTITKGGQKKIIHQLPWLDDEGQFAGLVEISIPIPESMPHFDRDAASS